MKKNINFKEVNMKFLLLIASFLVLSGCASTYQEPSLGEPVSYISFENVSEKSHLGQTITFFAVDDNYRPNKAFSGRKNQNIMAIFADKNPLVKTNVPESLKIPAKSNFRLKAQTAIGVDVCGKLIGFQTKEGEQYKVVFNSGVNFKKNALFCNAEIFHKTGGKFVPIQLNENYLDIS